MDGRRRPQMGSLKVVILRWSTRRVLMSRWNRVCWSETLSLWRGGIPGSEYHSLWRRGPPWGESHSQWIGESPWGESHSLRRKGLPWSESRSLWRGEAPWGETHPLGEGNPLDTGGPLGGDSQSLWRRGLPWSEYHSLWRGGAPEVNFIHLEKRTKRGLPWSESHSLWRGGAPWGESHSLGEGDPLDRGDLHEANPIRFGEGDPHEANPFAEERRKPLRWIHSLVHSLWRGGTPWRLPPVKEKGTPLNGVAYSRKIGAPWNATARARSLEAALGRWRSWGEGPSPGARQGPWRRNHSLWLEGDSHLFRRRGLPWTESPIVAI